MSSQKITPEQLRSRWWFDNPEHPGTTALCIERYMNYGITLEELTSVPGMTVSLAQKLKDYL